MELRVQDKVIPRQQCQPNQDAPGTKITKNRLKAGISQLNDFDTTSLSFSEHQPLAANRFQQKHTVPLKDAAEKSGQHSDASAVQ